MAGKLRDDWKVTLYPNDHWAQHTASWLPYSNKDGSFAHKELYTRIPALVKAKLAWRKSYGLVGWTGADPSDTNPPL